MSGPAEVHSLEESAWACLREIYDPCSLATGYPLNLDEMGLVSSVDIGADGDVRVHIASPRPAASWSAFS